MGPVAGPGGGGRPLRVVCLIDSLTAGGAEALAARWARSVDRRRVEPRLLCLKALAGNPFETELRDAGLPVDNLQVRNLRDASGFRRLLRRIESDAPDVLHAHLTYACIWGAVASWKTGVPLVATLHVLPDEAAAWTRAGLRERLMCRLLDRRASTVVTVSGAVASAFVERRSMDRGKVRVVPNGVDIGRFRVASEVERRSCRSALGLPANAPIVAAAAVLRSGKGMEVLLEAAPEVLRSIGDARFVLAGDGPLGGRLMRRAEELGIAERCHWLGFRDDLRQVYAVADVFVQPSDRPDALPTTLLEAMAAGLPVVASRIGGIPEIVADSGAGLLVPPGDPAALVAAILELLGEPRRREAMGRVARARVESAFSSEAWLEDLLDIYENAVGAGPRGPGLGRSHARPARPRATGLREVHR